MECGLGIYGVASRSFCRLPIEKGFAEGGAQTGPALFQFFLVNGFDICKFAQGDVLNLYERRFCHKSWTGIFSVQNGINFEHGISSFADRLDFDGGDKRLVAVEVAVAFGEGADGGEFIFTQIIGNAPEPPPQDDHVGGGEGKSQFIRRGLRRAIIVVFGLGVGFEGVFNQLAGVKAAPPPLEMELDAEAMHFGRQETIVF